MQLPRWLRFAVFALFVLWLGHQSLVGIAVDWLWFDAIGYFPVFQKSLAAKVGLWAAGLAGGALFLGGNLWLAMREGPIDTRRLSSILGDVGLSPAQLRIMLRGLAALGIGLPALLFAGMLASRWLPVLALGERQPFGVQDPVYGLDLSFYVFVLPVLSFAQLTLTALTMLALLTVGAYTLARDVFLSSGFPSLRPRARAHLLALGAAFFALLAAGWYLERFTLLFSQNGAVWGIGYTDATARIPGHWIMTACAGFVAIAFLVSTLQRTWRLPALGLGVYAAARVLVVGVWPDIVQDYFVKPNELDKETPYLQRNIAATNAAYALDRIERRDFAASSSLTPADVAANDLTIRNIRIWDTNPLLTTYSQIQEIRTYYDFKDVDVDRYLLDGGIRQVMLSARELNTKNLPAAARSWVNEHLQYTHGYGLTMSPVNAVTAEGLPELFIQDIPPASSVDLPVTRPEIYYGELPEGYVVVNSGADELDYPMGEQNAYARYAGAGGVPIGELWKQAVFAIYFQSLDLVLSQYILPESRLMFRRKITESAQRLAPFLSYDRDPYLVVADGRLVWMLDAYTTSEFYPYSEPVRLGRQSFNYIRNSVKVTVDAYNGSVDFYIADDSDPIIQTYARVFPGSFKKMAEMPDSLKAHVRYPSDFFDVQAAMYRAYHMQDPTVFYNKEDMWAVPLEMTEGQEKPMQSYYLIMRLPGENEAEFILLLPFVPTGRDNMISWLAARCDGDNYGKLILYQFPKQRLIYGPRQIEARIDQDPDISELITLWSQVGSRVVRGNLLVIPIGDALLYVEPLYLQAESSQLPELKRVIVSYENRIVMRPTLDEAIRAIFGMDAPPQAGAAPSAPEVIGAPPDAAVPEGWAALADQAAQQLADAEQKQRSGDWAGYGQALNALAETIRALQQTAEPAPEAPVEAPVEAEAPGPGMEAPGPEAPPAP